jgi:uncharacterized protein (DUF2235 family)
MTARNLVVFCDGTSNEVGGDHTNVLKLYRLAIRSEAQLTFYEPGVGTGAEGSGWTPLSDNMRLLLGLATGWGIDANIHQAYDFLCRHYRDGDRIFLFGFSRGAYTARAVAGMIQMIGLLGPDQANLIGYALTTCKRAGREDRLGLAGRFQRTLAGRHVPLHFLGVWDTVASVLVPRPDRAYVPSTEILPYTRSNPSVRAFRHACAIDERRRMFPPLAWRPDQQFRPTPFGGPRPVPQDTKTVWFAGCHSDVGGGYPETESAPAKFALRWMAEEARTEGLLLNPTLFDAVVNGKGKDHAAPDATAPLHDSMQSFWPLLGRAPMPGRTIEPGALLHSSVIERMEKTSYKPPNLPPAFSVVADGVSSAPKPRRQRRPPAQ